jgi:alpha-glucosidase
LEIATVVDSRLVYGFGERFSESFKLREGKLTMFNRDRGGILDKENGHQTYGYFPLYLIREQKGYFHINYLRSSNAMDVIVKNYSTSQYTFTYKVIGGIFDFRFFLGDTSAEATIQRFHQY